MKLIGHKLLLLIILALGLFLRVYDLADESIWQDERYSLDVAHLTPVEYVETRILGDVHPPLYYFMLHYWIAQFGESEFSIRLLSVVFSVLGIAVIYKLGCLMFNKAVGMLSSLILAISAFHILYAQETRMYSLAALLAAFSIYFLIRLLRKGSLEVSIAYVLFSSLLMYTHVYSLFIIVAQNIYVFTSYLLSRKSSKPNLRKWFLIQIVLAILYLPWAYVLVLQIKNVLNNIESFQLSYLDPPSIISVMRSFGSFSGSSIPSLIIFLLLASFSIINYKKLKDKIGWKSLTTAVQSYIRGEKSSSDAHKVYLLCLWLFVPIILPLIVSRFFVPIYLTRYTIIASMALYLLVAKGIYHINYQKLKLIVIGLVFIFSLVNVWQYYDAINKTPWRDVANYVTTNANSGDLVLFLGDSDSSANIFNYYSGRTDLIVETFFDNTEEPNDVRIRSLESVVNGYDNIWFINSVRRDVNLVDATLHEAYNLSYRGSYNYKYGGVRISLFEQRDDITLDLGN